MPSGKTIVLYFDFPSTSGNHAGMAYWARLLDQHILGCQSVRQPQGAFKGGALVRLAFSVCFALYSLLSLRKGDALVLLEYGTPRLYQSTIAMITKLLFRRFKVVGLVHLSYAHLRETYSDVSLTRLATAVDEVLVLGSSLETDLRKLGVQNIVRTFHYVDRDYYAPPSDDVLRGGVICMGALKRNISGLVEIVKRVPGIHFHVCAGRANLRTSLGVFENVTLHGYLSEDALRKLMRTCSMSLSVLEDTIGSNVIVTSLATGLVNVVSDVGSIRDYCTEYESLLFQDLDQCVEILRKMEADSDSIILLSQRSRERSSRFSVEESIRWLEGHLQELTA